MPEDEVCGICRVQFDGTCPTCKYPGDDCPLCETPAIQPWKLADRSIVIGKCAHSFHMVRHISASEPQTVLIFISIVS